jgi:hypothetical protein
MPATINEQLASIRQHRERHLATVGQRYAAYRAARDAGQLVVLTERAVAPAGAVDKAAGIIRNAKLLGLISQNGREYTEAALRNSVPLFESARVNLDHPPRGHEGITRNVSDWVGIVENVRFVPGDGLRGDIRLRRESAHFAEIMEAATAFPGSFGLSPNQLGRVVHRGGKQIVEAIERVRSVDMVTTPATTRGLFESVADAPRPISADEVRGVLRSRGGSMSLVESAGNANESRANHHQPLADELDHAGLVAALVQISLDSKDSQTTERLQGAIAAHEKYCKRCGVEMDAKRITESVQFELQPHLPAPRPIVGNSRRAVLTAIRSR